MVKIIQHLFMLMILSNTLTVKHKAGARMRSRAKQAPESGKDLIGVPVQSFGGIEEGWAKFFIYSPSSYILSKDNVKFF